ncbi:DUF7116 family protein [Natronorarus salvus]|uniref:DUF7116 family protein n=1 Tax=Natronorarus salvus TaxID=3117733 RepID=UPI002F26BFB4
MGTVTTSPIEQARSIFADLGYTVSDEGHELRAERDWKVVRVSEAREVETEAAAGELRCFVADRETASEFNRRLADADPEYEWALISVHDGDYRVVRAPPAL